MLRCRYYLAADESIPLCNMIDEGVGAAHRNIEFIKWMVEVARGRGGGGPCSLLTLVD